MLIQIDPVKRTQLGKAIFFKIGSISFFLSQITFRFLHWTECYGPNVPPPCFQEGSMPWIFGPGTWSVHALFSIYMFRYTTYLLYVLIHINDIYIYIDLYIYIYFYIHTIFICMQHPCIIGWMLQPNLWGLTIWIPGLLLNMLIPQRLQVPCRELSQLQKFRVVWKMFLLPLGIWMCAFFHEDLVSCGVGICFAKTSDPSVVRVLCKNDCCMYTLHVYLLKCLYTVYDMHMQYVASKSYTVLGKGGVVISCGRDRIESSLLRKW